MNVIVSIGRNTPDGPLAWGDWLVFIGETGKVLKRYGFDPLKDMHTQGKSHYADAQGIVVEECVTWAFTMAPRRRKLTLQDELYRVRKQHSHGQWGIAVTFGDTVMA